MSQLPSSPSAAYTTPREHLADELARIDALLRAEVVRWRTGLGASKPAELLGLLQISEGEINVLLDGPFRPPWQAAESTGPARTHLAEADRLARLIGHRLAATDPSLDLRLLRLALAFGLDRTGLDLLLVCYLGERQERYRRLYGYLQDDASRDRPSVELALRVVGALDRAVELLGTRAPLRRWRLLLTGGADDTPHFARPLQLDERVTEFLDDGVAPDARVAPLLLEPRAREPAPPASALAAANRWLERNGTDGGLLLLSGAEGIGRLALAREVARRNGFGVLVLDCRRLGGLAERSDLVLRLAMREALLQRAVLVLANAGPADAPGGGFPPGLLETLQDPGGLVVVLGEALPEPTARQAPKGWLHLQLHPPTFTERRAMWARLIGGKSTAGSAALAHELAGKFELTEGAAADALTAAQGLALAGEGDGRLTEGYLLEATRRCSGQRLLRYGLRIEPREAARFEDLVLPAPQHRQLEEVRTRIRLRQRVVQDLGFHRRLRLGRGFVVLFAGPSGVGKTMAAELLAKEQGIDLYKVDLALVVSKYVGETEKHLRQVFAEARALNAVVFFDEADALFGKRGEVKDARDRWANLEVNYLLQQVEEHDGVVVLATNLRQNLDEAFLRRIQAVIEFPFPDSEARLRVWRGMWHEFAPPPETEIATIAERLKLTGGAIRNIALDAAFRAVAAAEVTPDARRSNGRIAVTLRDVVAAAAREYQKHGRPVTESEFGPLWHSWVREDLF